MVQFEYKITNCLDFDSAKQFYLENDLNEDDILLLEEASQGDLTMFKRLAHRRLYDEPMAYILNSKSFMKIPFYIDNRAYIPNPETEYMVNLLVQEVQECEKDRYILDVGTGCGTIAIVLKNKIPNAFICGCDFHPGCVEIAKINAEKTNTDVLFFESFYVDNYTDFPLL